MNFETPEGKRGLTGELAGRHEELRKVESAMNDFRTLERDVQNMGHTLDLLEQMEGTEEVQQKILAAREALRETLSQERFASLLEKQRALKQQNVRTEIDLGLRG